MEQDAKEAECCNCARSEHKGGTCVQCHHYALAKRTAAAAARKES